MNVSNSFSKLALKKLKVDENIDIVDKRLKQSRIKRSDDIGN